MNASKPFESWRSALAYDKSNLLGDSKSQFKQAAQAFFDVGTTGIPTSKALFEYSTLMDAFESIQEARILKGKSQYDESFNAFSKSTEILRATMHFGFLSGYVSGCASLETALELEAGEDSFQGIKNAIALFEQSKLALSFRDENHRIIHIIDALIKYSISKAFQVESKILTTDMEQSQKKVSQSESLMKEYAKISRDIGLDLNVVDYFPVEDWSRALTDSLLVSFPDSDGMWLGNLGANPIRVEKIADQSVGKTIGPSESIHLILVPSKGRIRVTYTDLKEMNSYDEGCITVI